MTELARVPGTTLFADRSRHPETEVQPGVLVVRCESALLYFNVDFVRERVFELLQRASRGPIGSSSLRSARCRRSIWPAPSCSPTCIETFARAAIAFRVADAHGEVRDALRRIGFEREHGPLETGQTVDVVVTAWQASRAVTPPGYGGISGTPERHAPPSPGRRHGYERRPSKVGLAIVDGSSHRAELL